MLVVIAVELITLRLAFGLLCWVFVIWFLCCLGCVTNCVGFACYLPDNCCLMGVMLASIWVFWFTFDLVCFGTDVGVWILTCFFWVYAGLGVCTPYGLTAVDVVNVLIFNFGFWGNGLVCNVGVDCLELVFNPCFIDWFCFTGV